jgi:lipopolysaccharide export system protein LptA
MSVDTKNSICTLSGNARVSYITSTESYVFTANRIIVSYHEKNVDKIEANGKVVFTYLDLKDSSCSTQKRSHIFTSDKMTVLCNGKNVEKVEADGMVTFTYDKLKISSKSCSFDTSRCVSFDGEVVITDNKIGTVKADKAVYNIDTKNVDILAKNKVNLIIKSKRI